MQFPKIDKQYGLSNNYCSIFSVSRVSLEIVKLFWIIREAFTSTQFDLGNEQDNYYVRKQVPNRIVVTLTASITEDLLESANEFLH